MLRAAACCALLLLLLVVVVLVVAMLMMHVMIMMMLSSYLTPRGTRNVKGGSGLHSRRHLPSLHASMLILMLHHHGVAAGSGSDSDSDSGSDSGSGSDACFGSRCGLHQLGTMLSSRISGAVAIASALSNTR